MSTRRVVQYVASTSASDLHVRSGRCENVEGRIIPADLMDGEQ